MKKKTIKLEVFAIQFPEDGRIFSSTTGMGIFDHKYWADSFIKHHKLQKYTQVIPITISYALPPKPKKK